MSNIAAEAILASIRGVIEDGDGSARTIPARFDGGLYESLDETEKSRRALTMPIVETNITKIERSPHTYAQPGSLTIRRITVEIKVIRHLNDDHKLSDVTRDTEKALSVVDADMLSQALEYPGNLSSGEVLGLGTNTGLVSGRLQYVTSITERIQLADGKPGMIVTRHTFTGDVEVQL